MIDNIPDLSLLPSSWKGSDLSKKKDLWIKNFSYQELTELETATFKYLKSRKDLSLMKLKDFSLPTLSGYLTKLQQELKYGLGFQLLKGIPAEKYNIQQLATNEKIEM